MSDSSSPAAGWYADPENPAGERWWNGSGWSDNKRDATITVPEAAAVPATGAVPPPDGFTFGTATGRPDPYAPASVQPYYGSPSPYVAAPYGAPAPGQGANGLAIAGLIVSAAGWLVLGVLAGVAGIILSAFGLARAKQAEAAGNPNSGRGLAMAGLIVGIVVTAIGILAVVAYIVFIVSIGYPY